MNDAKDFDFFVAHEPVEDSVIEDYQFSDRLTSNFGNHSSDLG